MTRPLSAISHSAPIMTHRTLATWDGNAANLCMIAIQTDGFSHKQFRAHGIALPPSIAASVVKRQAEYFHGRLAARHALAPYGLAYAQVQIGSLRQPLWPKGIIGSITHNQRHAAAIALDLRAHGAIGIDLESVIELNMREALLAVVVSPVEAAYLSALSTPRAVKFSRVRHRPRARS